MRRSILLTGASLGALFLAGLAQAQSSTETYTYDALGRLISVETAGGQNNNETHSICYDDAGNRTQYVSDASGQTAGCGGSSGGNNPPEPQDDIVSYCPGSGGVVNLTANDTDPDGDYPLTLTNLVISGNGNAGIISASSVNAAASPTPGEVTMVTYTVEDSRGASATGTFRIRALQLGRGC